MKLVVAEKPSVAQSLAAVLGAKEKKDGPSRKPMGSSTPNGGMRICPFFPPIGNMMWQRIRKSSLASCAV